MKSTETAMARSPVARRLGTSVSAGSPAKMRKLLPDPGQDKDYHPFGGSVALKHLTDTVFDASKPRKDTERRDRYPGRVRHVRVCLLRLYQNDPPTPSPTCGDSLFLPLTL